MRIEAVVVIVVGLVCVALFLLAVYSLFAAASWADEQMEESHGIEKSSQKSRV